jgi:hypothetical protein
MTDSSEDEKVETPQSVAAAAAWSWLRKPDPEDRTATASRRRRALIESCVMLAVAGLILVVLRRRLIACVVGCMALAVAAGGCFAPGLYFFIKRLGRVLARAVGVCMSWILLVPFFCVVFTLARVALVLSRSDPLDRKREPDRASYWMPRRPLPDGWRYEKQY